MKEIDKHKQRIMQALRTGNLGKVHELLARARQLAADDVDVLRLSAQVSGQLGRFDETAECCERLLELSPGDAMAWAFLGNARLAAGDYQAALRAFDKAVSLAPEEPMVLINRGNALFLSNRLEEAVACLRRALQLAPDTANAHFNLGRVYKALGDFHQAIACFDQAVKCNPDLVDARIHLAGTLFEVGRLEEGERAALDAIRTHPDVYDYRNCLVDLYKFRGDYDSALAECDVILAHVPDNVAALGARADLLERKGEFDEAFATIDQLVTSGQLNVAGAGVYAKLCHRFDDCERAIEQLTLLLSKEALDEHRRTLHFALGNVFNRLERYQEAFDHYRRANEVGRISYDLDAVIRNFDAFAQVFSAARLERMPRAGNVDERPVFVIGMPRSGTSLVEQILSSHPKVFGAGELNEINEMVGIIPRVSGSDQGYPQCAADLDEPGLSELADTYLRTLDRLAPNAARIVDKMPHNFRHLGLISLLFPKARIIHCKRDPRDTCLSIYFQSFNQTHAYGSDLQTLGRYYRAYERLMAHWKSAVDLPIYEIRYADMIADQEKYSRELVEFCGLEWDERCLEFYKADRDVATASYDQVRRPLYKSSLDRWRRYEPYIQPLLDALERG